LKSASPYRPAARIARLGTGVVALCLATATPAQIPFTPVVPPSGVNNAFPAQNANGPTGSAFQANYPYAGQCNADPRNAALFPLIPNCAPNAGSFACVIGPTGASFAPQTAGGWLECGAAVPTVFTPLQPIIPASVPVAPAAATPKFVWDVLSPPDYAPDTQTFPGADYYEIGVHESWGFQGLATAGLFPNPGAAFPPVPNGMQWTGLVCNIPTGCSCPAGLTGAFKASYCNDPVNLGKIPNGAPLYTPIWGMGQINNAGGPVTQTLTTLGLFTPGTPAPWSLNNYVATWPSVTIRSIAGRPVVVKWVNEFPDNHLFCPHPEAADWTCAIDRTFMGVKAKIDPALATTLVPADGVNQYGSPQQPDNSWVTHLHGGEIPPGVDGFAEKWFGNSTTSVKWANVAQNFVQPPFENPSGILLKRPAGNADLYTYPMVNQEATIWFHDHTLGKTHHNVIAGPAGFFPTKEPAKHGAVTNGVCAAGANCDYTWIDPVTEPRNALNQPLFDLFLAIQDRAFNDDGSINFSNGLGQVVPAGAIVPVGFNPITAGANPQVHPVWVPEYFGDHVLVNGVLWPKFKAAPGWYRLRLVDGSDSRCWTIGFSSKLPAPGTNPSTNVPFYVLANDQGYLKAPVLAPSNKFTMCPGERYELLVNFGAIPGVKPNTPISIYMTNEAAAPFPAGLKPFTAGSPFAEMNVVMRFDVDPLNGAGVKSCGAAGAPAANTWSPTYTQAQMSTAIAGGVGLAPTACLPLNPALNPPLTALYAGLPRPVAPLLGATWPPGTIVRQVYLNERIDGVTLAPMGMQLNGVPFEYKVTETPKKGSTEVWQFINLTVDAHPMHPHLVKHLIVSRQSFSVARYKALLCGSNTCQPGTAPGGEMQVVPDVTPTLTVNPTLVTEASVEGGWKDTAQALPGMVTTIVAKWDGTWAAGASPTAPGTAGCPLGAVGCAAPYTFEDVTTGPYVWHCHINSHEDSEMMRTSLVVP
jgi:FtsP/CotA-like multicopper oxidase with cupredoxin domain